MLQEFIFSQSIIPSGLRCLGTAVAEKSGFCNTLYDDALKNGIVANVEEYCELDSDFRSSCSACCNKQENRTTGTQTTSRGD